MDMRSILASMDAGITIGVGATLIFAFLIFLMSNKKSTGDDETTVFYKLYNAEIEAKNNEAALDASLKHLPSLFKKTKNVNDLGEAFTMIAVASERLEKYPLALLCSDIACRYLSEDGVASYPLYRKCRERALEIGQESKQKLSQEEQAKVSSAADELWKNSMKSLGKTLESFA